MKNKFGSKIIIMVSIILSALLMAGFTWWGYTPVLINADKPFVELNGGYGDAIGGAKSSATNAYNEEHPTPTPTPTPTPKVDDGMVKITVCDEKISYGAVTEKDYTYFKNAFENGTMREKKIILIDDYAEARTFKKIIKLFEKAGTDYEIETNH